MDWALELLTRSGPPVDIDIYVTQERPGAEKVTATYMQGATIDDLQKHPELPAVLEPILAAKSDGGDGVSLVSVKGKCESRSVRRNYDSITVLSCGPPELSRGDRGDIFPQQFRARAEVSQLVATTYVESGPQVCFLSMYPVQGKKRKVDVAYSR